MPASTIPDEPHMHLYIEHIANHSSTSSSTVALTFDYTFFLTIITTANFILMHAVMVIPQTIQTFTNLCMAYPKSMQPVLLVFF